MPDVTARRHGASRRYGVALAGSVILLVGATIYTFARTGIGRAADPVPTDAAPLSEVGDTLAVRDPGLIRPPRAAYDRFAVEDSLWRASIARLRLTTSEAAGGVWAPSPLQAMRDSVFLLVQARRLDDAIAALGRWLDSHPDDDASRLEMARLLGAAGRPAEAIGVYETLLARRGDADVRAEYAGALVAADRLDEAAAQYRAILRERPDDRAIRLALAQALAWGGHPRDAERELVRLAAGAAGDTLVVRLLHETRAAFEPTAAEARRWVADFPARTPYRLALARALAREGRLGEAAAQLDTVLLAEATPPLLREAAGLRAMLGDSLASARLLGRAVALAPADTALLRAWAEALAWSGQDSAAIEAWTRLMHLAPSGEAFLARGRLHLFAGDDERAEADLLHAAPLVGYEAWAQLGDLYRWRGDHAAAIHAYRQALAARPNDPAVLASLRAAERERVLADRWGGGETVGWVADASFAEDNTGFLLVEAGVHRGFEIGRDMTASLGAVQRRVSHRFPRDDERYVYGYAVQGAVSRWFGRSQLRVHGGVARYADLAPLFEGGASVATTVGDVRVTASAAQAPAYPLLMTTRSLVDWSQAGLTTSDPLLARQAQLALALPLGDAEIAAVLAQLWLSDGNRRTAVQADVRYPVGSGFSLLYSGGTLGYAHRADGYWDPTRYTSHAAGVEYARHRGEGFSVAARVLPGIARSREVVPVVDDSVFVLDRGRVGQLSTSAEVGWRSGRWGIEAGVGYGRGREGDYQSLRGSITVRIAW